MPRHAINSSTAALIILALGMLAACTSPESISPGVPGARGETRAAISPAPATITSPLGVSRTLLWFDEFVPVTDNADGKPYIDRSKWETTYNTGWGPFLRAYGDSGGFHRWLDKDFNPGGLSATEVLNPFSFPEPGVLRIAAWPVPAGRILAAYSSPSIPEQNRMTPRARFASGLLASDAKFHYRFGYIEARIRMPAHSGSWPAFWMMAIDPSIKIPPAWGTTDRDHEAAQKLASLARPQFPEFDIMEYLGHVPDRYTTAIHATDFDGLDYHKPGPNLGDDWHTYGFDWSPTDWAFTFDGRIVQQGKAPASFAIDHYPILCLQIGGDWFAKDASQLSGKTIQGWEVDEKSMPWHMDVDYVRVWQ